MTFAIEYLLAENFLAKARHVFECIEPNRELRVAEASTFPELFSFPVRSTLLPRLQIEGLSCDLCDGESRPVLRLATLRKALSTEEQQVIQQELSPLLADCFDQVQVRSGKELILGPVGFLEVLKFLPGQIKDEASSSSLNSQSETLLHLLARSGNLPLPLPLSAVTVKGSGSVHPLLTPNHRNETPLDAYLARFTAKPPLEPTHLWNWLDAAVSGLCLDGVVKLRGKPSREFCFFQPQASPQLDQAIALSVAILKAMSRSLEVDRFFEFLEPTNPFRHIQGMQLRDVLDPGQPGSLPPTKPALFLLPHTELHVSLDPAPVVAGGLNDTASQFHLLRVRVYPIGTSKRGMMLGQKDGTGFFPLAWCTFEVCPADPTSPLLSRHHHLAHITFAQLGYLV